MPPSARRQHTRALLQNAHNIPRRRAARAYEERVATNNASRRILATGVNLGKRYYNDENPSLTSFQDAYTISRSNDLIPDEAKSPHAIIGDSYRATLLGTPQLQGRERARLKKANEDYDFNPRFDESLVPRGPPAAIRQFSDLFHQELQRRTAAGLPPEVINTVAQTQLARTQNRHQFGVRGVKARHPGSGARPPVGEPPNP